jgi:zeaxanthin glucosyltransferase
MARILFTASPLAGHLNPMLGPARRLARDHEIAFFSMEDLSARLQKAGIDCRIFNSADADPRTAPSRASREAFSARLRQRAFAARWFTYTIVETARVQVEALRAVMREWRPDCIYADPIVYAGPIAAELERIPWVAASSTFLPLTPNGFDRESVRVLAEIEPAARALFGEFGVEIRRECSQLVSPWLNVAFTTEQFTPRSLTRNDYSFFVGPSLPGGTRADEVAFPWHRVKAGTSLIYVASGSLLDFPPDMYERLIEFVLAESEWTVVVSHPRGEGAGRWGERVISVEFAPQLQLLERAACFVTHGGFNSVTESLSRGCPMIAAPRTFFDHEIGAFHVAHQGVGAIADPDQFDQATCRRLLTPYFNGTAREGLRAKAIAAAWAQTDSAETVCHLIEEVLRTGAPQRPAVSATGET